MQAAEELGDERLRAPCRKVLESLQVHWIGLTLFVDDSRIPMDNDASERKIRGPAVGRKNYYGSGALWSGDLSAMMFSIFATLSDWRPTNPIWSESAFSLNRKDWAGGCSSLRLAPPRTCRTPTTWSSGLPPTKNSVVIDYLDNL